MWSVGLTIPIALLMGFYLRYLRPGKVFEVSIIGIVLLVLAIASGPGSRTLPLPVLST